MPIDAMHTDDMPTVHPLAYYLTGPYADLAQAIIDTQKRLDVLEAKGGPLQDSMLTTTTVGVDWNPSVHSVSHT